MLEPLFQRILQRREEELAKGCQPYAKNNPTPSDLSDCARETALGILHWQDRPMFTTGARARMDVGIEVERKNLSQLAMLGFNVVEQQRTYECRHPKTGSLILRGKIDGKIECREIRKRPIIFDHKTVSPFLFPRMNTVEDLLRNRWYRKWVRQNMAYMFLEADDISFFFLDNNLGEWKFIEVPLDLELAEKTIKQCETAVEAVDRIIREKVPEEEALPAFHPNPNECRNCWAAHRVCFPPNLTADPLTIMSDEDALELATSIDRYVELSENQSEYNRLERTLKKTFAQKNNIVVGNWLITGKERSRKMPPSPGGLQKWWELDYQPIIDKAR